jgi:hypothetical protein
MLKSKLAFSDKFNQAKIKEIENMMKAIKEKEDLQTD